MAADRSVLAEVDQNIEPNQSYPEFVDSLEEAENFFRGSRKQMSPDSRAGNLQKDLEVHVCLCHVSMVNRKLEAGPSHGLS